MAFYKLACVIVCTGNLSPGLKDSDRNEINLAPCVLVTFIFTIAVPCLIWYASPSSSLTTMPDQLQLFRNPFTQSPQNPDRLYY